MVWNVPIVTAKEFNQGQHLKQPLQMQRRPGHFSVRTKTVVAGSKLDSASLARFRRFRPPDSSWYPDFRSLTLRFSLFCGITWYENDQGLLTLAECLSPLFQVPAQKMGTPESAYLTTPF